jgi:hypothetical protein
MSLVKDIQPKGTASAYVVAPFDAGKGELEKAGYRIIPLEKNARLRVQEGKDADVSRYGNWVREDAIYIPNKGKFLTKVSPIMANAKEATDFHRNGRDFYLTDEQVEECLADSVSLSLRAIPTNDFKNNEITNFAFGEYAKEYGEFLREAGITEMSILTANMQDKSFVRKVWFCGLLYVSVLDCNLRYLYYDNYRVRGVCEDALASEPTQKIETYNPKQIERALKELGFSGVSKGLVEKLRNL